VLLMLGGHDVNVDVVDTEDGYRRNLPDPDLLQIANYPGATHSMVPSTSRTAPSRGRSSPCSPHAASSRRGCCRPNATSLPVRDLANERSDGSRARCEHVEHADRPHGRNERSQLCLHL
jgi:hypothetical protein